MNELLLGAIGMSALVAGLIFARFWRTTRDRFFLFFAASFWAEGINRFLLAMFSSDEDRPGFYLIRLASFILIIIAIVDKNRSTKPEQGGESRKPGGGSI